MFATLASVYFTIVAVLALVGALAYAHSAIVDTWTPAVSGRQPIAAEGRAYRTALHVSGPAWRAVHAVGVGAPLATIVHRAALSIARYCYGCAPDLAYQPARFIGLAPVAPGTLSPWTALGLLVRWHLRAASQRVTVATGILRARLSMAGSIVAGQRGAASWLAAKAPTGLSPAERATLRRWNRYWEGCEPLSLATVTGSTHGRALLGAGHVVVVSDGSVWPSQAVQDWLDATW